jgi:uncharacterized membrane protein
MITSIDDYLFLLKDALGGSDPAIIHDALSDAEEHLRDALSTALETQPELSEGDALAQVIEKYGSPEEVAAAYREVEIRTSPALAPTRSNIRRRSFMGRFFGVFADASAWGALFYLLLFSLVSGIAYFTWAVTGISLSAGLIVLIIGLPFLGLFLLSVRGIALVEGRVVEALLGVRMPRRPFFSGKNPGWWGRFKTLVAESHTWLSIAYMILMLPLGIVYFTVFVTLIAVSLFCVALPILQLGFGIPVSYINGVSYHLAGWMLPLSVIAGVLLATLTMHLARHMGRWHGMLAKSLLVKI